MPSKNQTYCSTPGRNDGNEVRREAYERATAILGARRGIRSGVSAEQLAAVRGFSGSVVAGVGRTEN